MQILIRNKINEIVERGRSLNKLSTDQEKDVKELLTEQALQYLGMCLLKKINSPDDQKRMISLLTADSDNDFRNFEEFIKDKIENPEEFIRNSLDEYGDTVIGHL